MPASELIERVATLLADAALSGVTDPELDELARRLRAPARVAVVGRVNSGKSTLVNALLGQRVAPTDVSECTRLVTWFEYGAPELVEIWLRDGSRRDVQLSADGTLPATLGVPFEEVESLHVHLTNEALRWMTLIDTPGIGSVNEANHEATMSFLRTARASADALEAADAVVLLLNHAILQDEFDALQAFQTDGDNMSSAVNAVGVLSRADQLEHSGTHPMQVATELAGRFAEALSASVATVVPVAGLIAEAVETAALLESDATHIAALATLPGDQLARALRSHERFMRSDLDLPTDIRERLLAMLDLSGIEQAVQTARDGAHGANEIRHALAALSGIAEVKRTLTRYFHEQDHVLKTRSVLDALVKLSYRPVADAEDRSGAAELALQSLRTSVETLRLDPIMHPVAELETAHDVLTAKVVLPDDLRNELRRLFAPGVPAHRLGIDSDDASDDIEHLRARARDRMGAWRRFMVTEANPDQAQVARVALRSYQILWESL